MVSDNLAGEESIQQIWQKPCQDHVSRYPEPACYTNESRIVRSLRSGSLATELQIIGFRECFGATHHDCFDDPVGRLDDRTFLFLFTRVDATQPRDRIHPVDHATENGLLLRHGRDGQQQNGKLAARRVCDEFTSLHPAVTSPSPVIRGIPFWRFRFDAHPSGICRNYRRQGLTDRRSVRADGR